MIRRRIVRHEFVMSEAEFELFTMMCEPDKYAYGYYLNAMNEFVVTMKSDILYAVERALEMYIGEFEFDYECEVRHITTEEWNFYFDVKELFKEMMYSEEEEEEE